MVRAIKQRIAVSLLALGIVVPTSSWAATITAVSCSASDVQAAITRASNGDTVLIPNGACTWTSEVAVNGKAIILRGATTNSSLGGAGATVITSSRGDGFRNIALNITESAAGPIEVHNLKFTVPGRPVGSWTTVNLNAATNGGGLLFHHNTIEFTAQNQGGIDAIRLGTNRAVLWGNRLSAPEPTMGSYNNAYGGVRIILPVDTASALWAAADTMGTNDQTGLNNVYIESNRFENFTTELTDCADGGKMVFRHNVVVNGQLNSHGYDSSVVGCRHWEIYNNTLTLSYTTAYGPNQGNWIHLRGAEGVITDNAIDRLYLPGWGGEHIEVALRVFRLRDLPGPCYSGTYPVPRQVGQGFNGHSTFPAGAYIWNNSANLNSRATIDLVSETNKACSSPPAPQSVYAYLIENRDVFRGAKPGYEKYQFPHPLRSSSVGLNSPSNLRVQ